MKDDVVSLTIHMVDVFGSEPFSGNPVAVIAGPHNLTTVEMQQIVRWFNLSETTFLLPPTHNAADYQVRIFSLGSEMPFAGHPTLGTCQAWLDMGGVPKSDKVIIQQCEIGLVELKRNSHGYLSFSAPPLIRSGPPTQNELATACEFLNIKIDQVIDSSWIDNGPGWLGIELISSDAVLALKPQYTSAQKIDIGVVGPCRPASDAAFEIRAFFNDHLGNIREDPVTGSLNASVGQWLFSKGRVSSGYIARQGSCVGCAGKIYIDYDASDNVWIGGETRTHVSGNFKRD